jgi:hypothetical protein
MMGGKVSTRPWKIFNDYSRMDPSQEVLLLLLHLHHPLDIAAWVDYYHLIPDPS